MSDTEQKLRVELAACYRIFDYLGWSELIYNHITVKLPGPEQHFFNQPLRPPLQRSHSLQTRKSRPRW